MANIITRRKFVQALGFAPFFLNGVYGKAFGRSNMIANAISKMSDRCVILVRLPGGNDGLNNIVPINQYNYYKTDVAALRPTIGLPNVGQTGGLINLDATLSINDQVGFHPSLQGFKDLYDIGKMNLVQGVGYTQQNFSHFKSTDLWLTGGDGTQANFNIPDGWMARYLEANFPNYNGSPTTNMPDPLGIQLGDVQPSTGFHSEAQHAVEINLSGQDPAGFYTLISSIGGQPLQNIPAGEYGDELSYIMNVEQSVSNYSQRISSVFNKMGNVNTISYPNTTLANQLKTVARLLNGGSKTKVFLTTMSSNFDTHSAQVVSGATNTGNHANTLSQLSQAIKTFMTDINNMGLGNNVIMATFSEFGRKAKENGTFGTDHGTLSPIFVFGNGVRAGVTGTNVDLSPTAISNGQLTKMLGGGINDYRQVFTTILQDWLGADQNIINSTLFGNYLNQKLNIIDKCNVPLAANSLGVDVPVSAGTQTFKAAGTLIGSNLVSGNATKVAFKAGQSVTLSPGFKADSGTTFTATVETCVSN